jgi:hypothetical protein
MPKPRTVEQNTKIMAAAEKRRKPAEPKTKTGTPKKDPEKFAAECVRLYRAGTRHISDLAVAMGYPRGHGQNRCAAALIRNGLYRGHRKTAA